MMKFFNRKDQVVIIDLVFRETIEEIDHPKTVIHIMKILGLQGVIATVEMMVVLAQENLNHIIHRINVLRLMVVGVFQTGIPPEEDLHDITEIVINLVTMKKIEGNSDMPRRHHLRPQRQVIIVQKTPIHGHTVTIILLTLT